MGEVIGDLNARNGQIEDVGFRGGKRLVRGQGAHAAACSATPPRSAP